MNRRSFLKTSGISLASLAALCLGCGSSNSTPAAAASTNANEGAKKVIDTVNGKKILIAYYSWGGNTKAVAEEIHKQVGCDFIPITPVTPYPEDYNATVDQAKLEQQGNARPAIKANVPNMEQYDIVFIGYPNWWGSYPMLVATFVESYNFDNKVVLPFFTHGGGGIQRCESDLRKLLPNAQFGSSLCLSGSNASSCQGDVAAWLKKEGF